jgi:hypothetical protein
VLGKVDLWWPGAGLTGSELAEGTVRPGGVVVLKVLGQHPAQLVLLDDQQPAEDLAPHIPGGKQPGQVRAAGWRPVPARAR